MYRAAADNQTDRKTRTDLFPIALLGSNSLLSFAFSPPDLRIGICQLAHQICLRSVALSSSVLTELTLDCCQLSLCTSLQFPTSTLNLLTALQDLERRQRKVYKIVYIFPLFFTKKKGE